MKAKYSSRAFSLIICSICLFYSTMSQIRVTAAYYNNKVDSLAHTYASKIQLGPISCSDLDTAGKSSNWHYIYIRLDSIKEYHFTGSNNQVTFDSTCKMRAGVGVTDIPWIDSYLAYVIADRSGGSNIRKRFPTCTIMSYLSWDDLPDNMTRWRFLYKCSDSTRMISLNAANGVIVSVRAKENNVDLDQFTLYQNYPNPFNPTTNISFTLLKSSFVSLKIFDVTGREITTIINKEMSAGYHICQWNAINSSSGIYYYRLVAGSITQTKKLIVLR